MLSSFLYVSISCAWPRGGHDPQVQCCHQQASSIRHVGRAGCCYLVRSQRYACGLIRWREKRSLLVRSQKTHTVASFSPRINFQPATSRYIHAQHICTPERRRITSVSTRSTIRLALHFINPRQQHFIAFLLAPQYPNPNPYSQSLLVQYMSVRVYLLAATVDMIRMSVLIHVLSWQDCVWTLGCMYTSIASCLRLTRHKVITSPMQSQDPDGISAGKCLCGESSFTRIRRHGPGCRATKQVTQERAESPGCGWREIDRGHVYTDGEGLWDGIMPVLAG